MTRCGRRAAVEITLQGIGRTPGIFAILDRERRDVDVAAVAGEEQRFLEQGAPAIDVGRIEHARRQLAPGQRAPHEIETARTVAEMQMDDAGLAAHQAADMRLGGDAQQFVEGRLAAAVVADGQFADADQRIDEGDVAAHAAGQRGRRHMVATAIAPGAEALLAQGVAGRRRVRAVLRAQSSVPSRPITEVTPFCV